MAKKAAIQTDSGTISQFLTRGVENVYPSRDAVAATLASGKQLTVYYGIDPTGPSVHIGHAIPLKKAAMLQKMGHRVILLIGDFTAMIGDPTDKSATRKRLTREEVLANCKNYKKQISSILDFSGSNPVEIKFNSSWLAKMSFVDVVELAAHFTVQQMAERDMFKKRLNFWIRCPHCGQENILSEAKAMGDGFATLKKGSELLESKTCNSCSKKIPFFTDEEDLKKGFEQGRVINPKPVYLHEFLYPLMQGYDSVAMDVDMELGGNDQTFNMLAGRTLMREMKQKEKSVVTMKLLADPTGKKMGKSEGNMIALTDAPEDMYGKVMSWTDGMIVSGFELCTDVPDAEIDEIRSAMNTGENPVQFKHRLAKEIVQTFLGEKAADVAAAAFAKVHQNKEMPEEIANLKLKTKHPKLVDVLVEAKMVTSKTEARRQIEQGGVKVEGTVVKDVNATVNAPAVIQKGKRHFVRIVT